MRSRFAAGAKAAQLGLLEIPMHTPTPPAPRRGRFAAAALACAALAAGAGKDSNWGGYVATGSFSSIWRVLGRAPGELQFQ